MPVTECGRIAVGPEAGTVYARVTSPVAECETSPVRLPTASIVQSRQYGAGPPSEATDGVAVAQSTAADGVHALVSRRSLSYWKHCRSALPTAGVSAIPTMSPIGS